MPLDQISKQQCLRRNVKCTNVISANVFRTNVFRTNVITTHIPLTTNALEESVS